MPNTSSKLIRVGHSPDADDAFMFYALAKKKIPMHGFEVEHVIEDIESLNQRALRGELEVTAVSCHAYAYLADRYAVMRSGASVGDNYGPILVQRATGRKSNPAKKRIAIPGKLTTAYLTLRLYSLTVDRCALHGFEPVFLPFDMIIDAVKNGDVDFGLVIHEGQITYAEHGLEKVLDLGVWWHEKTKLPLSLGVDIIRRDLGKDVMRSFAGLFKESIEYALSHRREALEYALRFGRGISEDLNDRFVAMYVNDRTVDIGKDGEAGFRRLMDEAYQHKIIPHKINLEFI
jgi:1,4-dihydroxy-6-naphthoate synthase